MDRECSQKKESRIDFKILTGKSAGKRLLGRPKLRWEGNIRMRKKYPCEERWI